MTITAKFAGRCAACGAAFPAGTRIEWEKGSGARHAQCPSQAGPQAPSPDAPYRLMGGEGYGDEPFVVGAVVRNRRRGLERGEPEWLVVVTARQKYYREDGMSFGVGDEAGYVYSATARAATPEEAAPHIEARERLAARKAALAELDAIFNEVQAGEAPAATTADQEPGSGDPFQRLRLQPEGEVIPVGAGRDLYGGGRWFVVGPEFVWAVRNNGADGDNWAWNNVVTGGAGAVGRRVPHTPELEGRIRAAAAVAAAA